MDVVAKKREVGRGGNAESRLSELAILLSVLAFSPEFAAAAFVANGLKGSWFVLGFALSGSLGLDFTDLHLFANRLMP